MRAINGVAEPEKHNGPAASRASRAKAKHFRVSPVRRRGRKVDDYNQETRMSKSIQLLSWLLPIRARLKFNLDATINDVSPPMPIHRGRHIVKRESVGVKPDFHS